MSNTSPVMIIQFTTVAILFFEFLFAISQKASKMQTYIIITIISCILMFVGYNIELSSPTLEAALVGAAVSYMGKPFIMLASFMFICSFYNQKIPNWLVVVLAVICGCFPILVFTNHHHYLYYATTVYDSTRLTSPLLTTRGPLYYLYMILVVIYFVACVYVIISNYRKINNKANQPLTIYLILMVFCGVIGYIVFLLDITSGYDTTMTGVFGSVICIYIMFVRYHIFDALAIAKDQALEDSTIGLVVMNQQDEVVYKNKIVNTILKNGVSMEYLKHFREGNDIYSTHGLTYSISNKEIMDGENYLGRSIEITDITDSANYQKRLEKEIKERTDKLEKMQREIVASVANIVEARSVETGEHIKRAGQYVFLIAEALMEEGYYTDVLNEEYVRLLVSATPLHDIGKISIPDSILLKPGKLNDEEYKIMQKHTEYGEEIIEKTMRGLETDEYVMMAEEIAKYHHEHYDGKGYPCQLRGQRIPLSARIVALADCFDALTSKRCYKSAYSKEESIEIIRKESGKQFDPIIVEMFVKAIQNYDLAKNN